VTGTPASFPCAPPFRHALVAVSAAARAASNIGVTITLQIASVASSASITSSITSEGVNVRAVYPASSSVADIRASSPISGAARSLRDARFIREPRQR
jgi:hypothetical protein